MAGNLGKAGTAHKGSGKRRRYRGKTVLPNGSPKAHTHGGHSRADRGFECGGKKVSMKPNRSRFTGFYRNATTGEPI